MALVRGGLFLLLLSLAAVAESSFSFNEASLESAAHFDIDALRSRHVSTCNGQVGDCIDVEEEMMMGSEGARRVLARQRYFGCGSKNRTLLSIVLVICILATVRLGQTMSHAPNVAGPTTTATGGEGLTLTPVAAVASQGVLGAK
ncbi:hypothetical protein RHSIM_Rhsim13G0179200 [Rhododendron simsii]|uniref:Uncharacterized protein n=1 Tax=Rhododendron simsii TaxID=118357 RepID=A0A834G3Q7_RHOSS|nr:hypothetical protein RHSIM_Rhsim13G0179200 [Rhododendron simsii]